MNYVLDILVLAILAISIYFSYKKGLIITLFSFFGTIISFFAAKTLSDPVSAFIDEKFVFPLVRGNVEKAISSSGIFDIKSNFNISEIAKILSEIPKWIKETLQMMNVDLNSVFQKATEYGNSNSIEDVKNKVIDNIASPISSQISYIVSFILLFIAFVIIIWISSRLLTKVFSLIPFGKKVNQTGGIIFGVLRGLLIVFILSFVLCVIFNPEFSELIKKTFIFKYIEYLNPITMIFK